MMQTKALALDAPKSMILDAYKKHASIMQKVTTTDGHLLKDFRTFIQPWINALPQFLRTKTRLPNSHATIDNKRSEGGLFIDQFSKMTNQVILQPDCPRIEPFCIAISGNAGNGKSLIQNRLAHRWSKYLGRTWEETVYTRSSLIKHWDGYMQQPLSMIDDFGQKTVRYAEDSSEASEFITMCSSVDYRVPMAHLSEKGKKFNSPLLLLSTNHNRSIMNKHLSKVCCNHKAIDRRFDRYFSLERHGRKYSLYEETLDWDNYQKDNPIFNGLTSRKILIANDIQDIENFLFQTMLIGWKTKTSFYRDQFLDTFQQEIGGDWYLEYPREPIHNNHVKTHAIIEPLKVRMITVGAGENWALKPLQIAMFNALSKFPEFLPCFTPDYDDQIKEMKNLPGKWLSGDYSSATDGLHSSMMNVVVTEMCNILETYYPELIPYVLMEASPHTVKYPSWTQIEPIVQTNGQLMGSLLSFPILSLVNAFTIGKATGKSLGEIPALIHGDDVLARISRDSINRWKTIAPLVGLELSIGKNYISNSWGSIDSQVFYEGVRISQCGKWKGLGSNHLESIPLLLKRGFPKGLIVRKFKQSLTKSHRSLEVSVDYGGLNPNPGHFPQTPTDHAQYVTSLSRSCKIRKVANMEMASIPLNWIKRIPFTVTKLPFELPQPDQKYPFSDFRHVLKFRDMGASVPLTEIIPLDTEFMYIELQDYQKPFLKNIWKSQCPVLTSADKEYFTQLNNINCEIQV
jgi:hypothetical protein